MITPEQQNRISKRLEESQLGYGKISHPEYAQDVALLVIELRALEERASEELSSNEALVSANALIERQKMKLNELSRQLDARGNDVVEKLEEEVTRLTQRLIAVQQEVEALKEVSSEPATT